MNFLMLIADTREQPGGSYIINVRDRDTALDWTSRIPAPGGVIEVRPCLMPLA